MSTASAGSHLATSMTLVKHGHACVELRTDDVQILVDPGTLGPIPDPAQMSAVLVTPVDAPWLRAVDLMEFVRRCTPAVGDVLTVGGTA